MRKSIVVFLLLLLAACDWHPTGEDPVPGEDWSQFDYVFVGSTPDYIGAKTYMKINILDDGSVDGEVMGAFYTKFAGTLLEGDLELAGQYINNACPNIISRAWFAGEFTESELTGAWSVESCVMSEIDFDGMLVGGREKND